MERKLYGTGASWERHDPVALSVNARIHREGARSPSSNTVIESFTREVAPGTADQLEDGCQVAKARDRRGSLDRTEGAAFHRLVRGRGGDGCRVSTLLAPAAWRLSPSTTADAPAIDAVYVSSMPAAPWHLAPAGCPRVQAEAPAVQMLSNRRLPYGHCRGPDS